MTDTVKIFNRIGNTWKLSSITLNGIKYFMIGKINEGVQYIYTDNKSAVEMFGLLERMEIK